MSLLTETTNQVYWYFDTFIYYIINIIMCLMVFAEVIMESVDHVLYNINILKSGWKHKMYNNIN